MKTAAPTLLSAAVGTLGLVALVAGGAWGFFDYEAGAAVWLGVKVWLGVNAVTAVAVIGASAVGQYSAQSQGR